MIAGIGARLSDNSVAPSYLKLLCTGELERRVRAAREMQSPCRLCPRTCGARRAEGEKGFCESGAAAKVFRYGPHFGEEPPITGTGGSGTVFLSGCTLRCAYCQNYQFSQEGEGAELSIEELSLIFLALKRGGCHNLNWVTPSHFLPQLLAALALAAGRGFDLPVVYNTSGYESLETLRILDGCADVYLADMRYDSPEAALKYSGARDYPEANRLAIAEMWRQVGPLDVDGAGVARRGLIIRHLVLPRGIGGTRGICRFIAEGVSTDAAVSLMSQYTPCHRAVRDAALCRGITEAEYSEAVGILASSGLGNGWIQEWGGETEERFLGAKMEGNVTKL